MMYAAKHPEEAMEEDEIVKAPIARLTRTQNRLIHRYSQQASDIFVALLEFIIQNQLSPVQTQAVLDCIILSIRLESRLNMLKYISDSTLTATSSPE